jgi:hypothetical protein
MHTRLISLAIVALFGVAYAQPFVPPAPMPLATPYMGAASCSASACHNHEPAHGVVGSEYAVWGSHDPHARAYEVLFNDVSMRIHKHLGGAMKPHEDPRCLKCHVGVEMDDDLNRKTPYFRTDGVSCESCHGPARQWLTTHYAPSWRDKTPAQKRLLGMKDTKSVRGRVTLCVTCHVGDIDHDLIAAGHPRLSFEFNAFHEAMPHHWRPDANSFETRAWLAGQLATTHAALNLLAERAEDQRKPWPEFAEHDCAACHHDLGAATKKTGRAPLPWNAWNLALTPQVLNSLDTNSDAITLLQKELANGWHDRKAIATKARRASGQWKPLLERDELPIPSERLLRDILAMKSDASLDERAQVALALAALRPPETQIFATRLTLPVGYARSSLHPLAIRERLIAFKSNKGK